MVMVQKFIKGGAILLLDNSYFKKLKNHIVFIKKFDEKKCTVVIPEKGITKEFKIKELLKCKKLNVLSAKILLEDRMTKESDLIDKQIKKMELKHSSINDFIDELINSNKV